LQKDKSWYQKSAEDAFDALESGTAGLSTDESRARLGEYGYNELKFKKSDGRIASLLRWEGIQSNWRRL